MRVALQGIVDVYVRHSVDAAHGRRGHHLRPRVRRLLQRADGALRARDRRPAAPRPRRGPACATSTPTRSRESLVWMVERCNNVLLGHQGRSPEAHVDALTAVWVHALYPDSVVAAGLLIRRPRPAHGHTTGYRAADRLGPRMASEASVHHPIFARLFAWGASNAPAEQTEHRRQAARGTVRAGHRGGRRQRAELPALPRGGDRGAGGRAGAVPAREGRGGRRAGARCRCASSTGSRTRCRRRDGGVRRRRRIAGAVLGAATRPVGARRAAPGDPPRRRAALLRARARRRIRATRAARTASTGFGRASPAAAIPTATPRLRSRRPGSRSSAASASSSSRCSA